jgi:hypothetical protein
MNIIEQLDLAIKAKETGTTEGVYTVPYRGGVLEKPTYMTNGEWKAFLNAMPEMSRLEYAQGGGDELSEKDGRPPKMASYGSSSRMIYNLSRDKEGFHYEKKLPTTVGGKANLDGFCESAKRYLFVEAKCHEPYSFKRNAVSTTYAALYNYINTRMAGSLRIAMETSKCGRYMNVDYFAEDERLERFDLKQMICHLLGIATGLLSGTLEQKQIDFVYLLFDPTELTITADAKAAIDAIYERTCYECNLVDFAELFRVVLEFLRREKFPHAMSDQELDTVIYRFTFTLASQEFYPILIQ